MSLYAAYDFSSCLAQHGNPKSAWGQSNQCVPDPSSLNPYNITSLGDFNMSMLEDILTNTNFGINLGLCHDFANILPSAFPAISRIIRNPKSLNLAVLALQNLTQRTVPSPYNASGPANVTSWWFTNVEDDTQGSTNFLNASVKTCTRIICKDRSAAGDPDITGIGTLLSTSMLVILTFLFIWPTYTVFALPSRKQTGIRRSLINSLEDFFNAISLFTLSILMSTIIYRSEYEDWNLSLYSIFMAEVLSLVASTVMVLVAASKWQHRTECDDTKVSDLCWIVVNSLLTIVLFAMEFWYQRWLDPGDEGLPMEHQCLRATLGGGIDLNSLGHKNVYLPICFTLWALALLGSVTTVFLNARGMQHSSMGFRVLGSLSMVLGSAGLIWLCVMFYDTWRDMQMAFGHAFLNTEQDWTFGQFLALFTWFPPVLTFLNLHFGGRDQGDEQPTGGEQNQVPRKIS